MSMVPPLLDVDEITVISLRESTDRQKSIRAQFPPGVPFRFHIVERDPQGGRAGCYRSHAAVIEDARKRNLRRILVLEDDACLVHNWDTTVQLGNAALNQVEEQDPDWCYLLLFMFPIRNGKSFGHIRKVYCAGSAAAYIVNLHRFQDNTLPPYDGRHVDNVLFCNYSHNYGAYEELGHGAYVLSSVLHRFTQPLSESQNHMYATQTFLFRPDDDFLSTIDPIHKFFPYLMNYAGVERSVELSVFPGFDVFAVTFFTAIAAFFSFVLYWLLILFKKNAAKKQKNDPRNAQFFSRSTRALSKNDNLSR
jgi:GR25 family glycosyltransferase involved in LPS biosynthesis